MVGMPRRATLTAGALRRRAGEAWHRATARPGLRWLGAAARRAESWRSRAGLPWPDLLLAFGVIATSVLAVEFFDSGDAPATVFRDRVFDPAVPLLPPDPRLGDDFTGIGEDNQRFEVSGGRLVPDDGGFDEAPIVNVIAGVAVALRRRLPLTSFAVAAGSLFLIQEGLLWPGFIGILICGYSAVAYGRSAAVSFAALAVAAVAAGSVFSRTIPPMPNWLGPILVLVPVGLAAAALRNARGRADAAARRAAALEAEQEAAARAAIAEERARIARELHDVVSHHVSVMVIQAGAAGKVIGSHPHLAQGALGAIESSGREAMAELRHLLGLLAPVDDRLHPQPGLADLDALIAKVRAAGQPVTVQRDGTELPSGLDLTAYRVVQEGLTNALRYAPGAPTTVHIRHHDGALVVEVTNTATAREPLAPKGAGRGLLGLTERVRLLHGTLEARHSLSGGFRLSAHIPLEAAP